MKSIVMRMTIASLALLGLAGMAFASPDLHVSQFQMSPATPIQGEPVTVRMIVYNRGTERSGPFRVEWWPGENYAAPAQTWLLGGMNARGGRVLTFTYAGYPSRYARINTKVVVDSGCHVAESDERNNVYRRQIRVAAGASAGHGLPDLYVSQFRLSPTVPRRGDPVSVRISVNNRGAARSGPFRVQWWPGENYAAPAQSWMINGMNARGGRVLTYNYPGYPSFYRRINTRVVVDGASQVAESDEHNNDCSRTLSVSR